MTISRKPISPGLVIGIASAALVTFALARLAFVHLFCSDIPFWDQWDSETWGLLRPFERGELSWAVFLSAHLEHHIFLSKLEILGLYLANNHQWDNLVSTSFNAVFYAVVFALVFHRLMRELSWRIYLPFFVFVLLAACLPIGAENILSGFQSVFYFMNALTVTGIWLASTRQPTWKLLVALTLCAYLSMLTLASGLLTAPAIVIALLLRRVDDVHLRTRIVVISLAVISASLVGIWIMPAIPGHAALHAQTLIDFLDAGVVALSWPFAGHWWNLPLIWGPYSIGCLLMLRNRPYSNVDIAAAGVGAWVVTQGLAMAFSRGHEASEIANRYTDILLLGSLVNVYFAVSLCHKLWNQRPAAALIFSALLMSYLAAISLRTQDSIEILNQRAALSSVQIAHVRKFIESGQITDLSGLPPLNIPYPDPQRLAMMLSDPTIRNMLSPSIRSSLHVSTSANFVRDGYYPSTAADPARTILGSYVPGAGNFNTGELTSGPLTTRFPYLSLDVAGYTERPGLTLSLQSDSTKPIVPALAPHETWARLIIAAPETEFFLKATDSNPDFWLAFSEPVEMGRLSALVNFTLGHLALFLKLFAAIAAFAFFYIWMGKNPFADRADTEAENSARLDPSAPQTPRESTARVLRHRKGST